MQEIENLLGGKAHESMIDTSPCTQHNPASVIHRDAETQCETTNLFDAETQCEKGVLPYKQILLIIQISVVQLLLF